MAAPIQLWGDHGEQGSYVLTLALSQGLTVAFGRFQAGRSFTLSPGFYLYVGSAMGRRGATTLAGRLLRHATRSGDQPPHALRPLLHQMLQQAGLIAMPPAQKRCRWHIDYLLDQPAAELIGVDLLRTNRSQEANLAAHLQADPATRPVATGLGASDHPGATHLFQLIVDPAAHDQWRQRLVDNFARLLVCSD